jgi:hypothetical protein
MTIRNVQILLVLLAVAGVSRADIAELPEDQARAGQAGHWLLAKYDFNGDSVISADEIAYRRERVFEGMDADADGVVSLDEYHYQDARKREVLIRARFLKLDLDGDGDLTAEEYSSYLGSFDRFDSDGDGYVSEAEMKQPAAVQHTAPERHAVDEDTHCLLWLCVRTSF